MIDIGNLTLTMGERKLYDKLSWRITDGSKVGLVGINGSGKTTLLRTIMGETEFDEGNIVILPTGARIGYLPQDLHELPLSPVVEYLKTTSGIKELEENLRRTEHEISELTQNSPDYLRKLERYEVAVRDYEIAGGYSFDAIARKTLKGLGFSKEDPDRCTSEFSGGWKMRISLACALLSRPDILLLDEPTNHLDTESMEWLESWLQSFSGTVITISHDRHFMDKLMTSIAELSRGRITLYKGNYSDYLEESAKRLELLEKQQIQQKSEREKTQQFIDKFRYKATKATQVQSRIKKLEKMELVDIERAHKVVNIRFPDCPRSGDQVVKARELGMSYENIDVFSDVTFNIKRGENIALVGVNGAGKSTLSRLVSGIESPTSGTIELGHNVKLGFFSQESSQNLNYDNTIWQEIYGGSERLTPAQKRSLLGAFLFSGDDIHKSISVLSGGEKSRVALVKLLLSETNFLILDEPTNHLDMSTKDLFQKALLSYEGTILVVSHDRYFLDNLVDRVMEIRDHRLFNYLGNYSYFVEKRANDMDNLKNRQNDQQDKKNDVIPEKEKKRLEAEKRNKAYRDKKVFLKELKPLEKLIEKQESRKTEIESLLCDPSTLSNSDKVTELTIEFREIEKKVEESLAQWEFLMEEIEKVESTI